VKYLRLLRVGRCSPSFELWSVYIVFKWVNIRVFLDLWRHRRSKLDSCHLILEDVDPIRLGTMMDDYGEVLQLVRIGVMLSWLLLIDLFKSFSNGSISGFEVILA
jgi:hypothetical protein